MYSIRFLTATSIAAALLLVPALSFAADVDPGLPSTSSDRELLRLGADIEGFGGYFFDSDGHPTVFLRDPAAVSPTRLEEHFGGEVRVLVADYDIAQLAGWKRALRPILALEGVVYLDLDEGANRLRMAVDAAAVEQLAPLVEARAASLGVPSEAVEVVASAPVTPASQLDDYIRPVPGGVLIRFDTTSNYCSLGFNALLEEKEGLVTASHCSAVWGGVDGTDFYQPSSPDKIADENTDPPFTTGGACPLGRRCRFSDSLFAKYSTGGGPDRGKVARTTYVGVGCNSGSTTIDSSNPRFTVTAKNTSGAVQGQILDKVGATTGWTSGQVASTCVDMNVSSGETFFCQSVVDAAVWGGDSGSPVFDRLSSSTIEIYGILWARIGGCQFVYSPISGIETDFGGYKLYP